MRSHHPVEPNHVFPIGVVKRHMVLRHFTQGVDVFPGPPSAGGGLLREVAVLACLSAAHLPHNADLADDLAHELRGTTIRSVRRDFFPSYITAPFTLNFCLAAQRSGMNPARLANRLLMITRLYCLQRDERNRFYFLGVCHRDFGRLI